MHPEPSPTPTPPPTLMVTCVPAFDDNYLWLIHGDGAAAHHVAAVDPGDADAINAVLDAHHLTLDAILVTHHHGDHVGGVTALASRYHVPVYGPANEDIPARSIAVQGGDTVALPTLGLSFQVIDVPGHTAGHVAYVGHHALFCGDTLFSGGCGRLFEGTPAQMLHSLAHLAALAPETRVYCAHEYTAANLKFALAVEPGNRALAAYAGEVAALRARRLPTIPTTIGRERAINPFLRSRLATVRDTAARHAGRAPADDADAFGQLREWKNEFRG